MKKLVLSLALLLATLAPSAMAQPPGVNLAWDDCGAGINKTSTCQSNTEAAKMLYGSYVLPSDVQALAGNDIVLDICVNSPSLPCWWNFTVAPRTTGYQVQFNQPCANAFDYWSTIPGGATGSSTVHLMPSSASPNFRITASAGVDGSLAQPVPASVGEIYSFTFRLLHDATVGCSGCLFSAALVLRMIRVTQVGSPDIELTTHSFRNVVFWEGGPVTPNPCWGGTPVINKTWGSVRALYR